MAGARCSEVKKKKEEKERGGKKRERGRRGDPRKEEVLRNLFRIFVHCVLLDPTASGIQGPRKSKARESALPTILNRARKKIKIKLPGCLILTLEPRGPNGRRTEHQTGRGVP